MRKSRFMLLLGGPGSLILVASLALPASAAARPGTTSYRPASAVAVAGMVTTRGKAEPGAKVYIHAWPDQDVIQALKVGRKVPWVLVGTGTTNSSGKYSISLPKAKLMPEATDGVVNLEADTKSGGYSFSVVVSKNAGNAYLAGPAPVVNLASNGDSCLGWWQYYASMGKHWATVGQTYVPASHATQSFSYAKGQSSSIGVGASASGDKGSFHADGSMSWTNRHASSSKGSWPTYGARRSVWYRTEFHFGEYQCNYLGNLYGFEEHVNGYFGGGHIMKPNAVPRTHKWNCANYVSGFKWQSNNSAAIIWRKSLGIHAGLSFDASVETGYDSDAQVTYKLYRSRWICGTNGPPGSDPKEMVVRSSV